MSVLICIHNPLEGPDVFGKVLDEQGAAWEALEFFADPNCKAKACENYSHLVIMGGSMNVDQTEEYPFLLYERELIREFIRLDRPVLGICLGAQLIARALGVKVYQNGVPEIGWSPIMMTQAGVDDPLLADFNRVEPVFQWHGDTFDMPQGCEWLAKSELCAHQALRYGAKTYGLQFHLEVTANTIRTWLESETESDRVKILAQTSSYAERANEVARRFFRRWLAL